MRSLLLVLGLVVALISGCARTRGTQLDSSKVGQIQKGVTTRAGVESLLGPPASVSMAGHGRRTMVYFFNETKVKGQTFIPYAGLFVGGADSRQQLLQILLTKDNIVEDYEFNDQASETTGGVFKQSTTSIPVDKKK